MEAGGFHPCMETILNAFGVERIMLGSDYPVCTVAASYEQVWDINLRFIESLTAEERKKIRAENAIRFYNLNR